MKHIKQKLPTPSTVEEVAAYEDAQGGTVVLLDIDMSFLDTQEQTQPINP